MLNKFSEELKQARVKSGINLQQIATQTRIDFKFLENIEAGNFTFLPELYIKAFLKEYARMVGLDEKIVLKKFDAAKKSKVYDEFGNVEEEVKKVKAEEVKPPKPQVEAPVYNAPPAYEPTEQSSQRHEASAARIKSRNMLIGISVGVVVVLVVVYFAFIKSSSEIIVSEKPYDQVQKDNEQRSLQEVQKPAVTDSSSGYAAKSDSLSLVIDASDASWIKVLIDGSKTDEFTLFTNSNKEIKALKSYRMTIGNAGAIRMKLNNKPLNFTGNKHEVKYVSIDSTGLQYVTPSAKPVSNNAR